MPGSAVSARLTHVSEVNWWLGQDHSLRWPCLRWLERHWPLSNLDLLSSRLLDWAHVQSRQGAQEQQVGKPQSSSACKPFVDVAFASATLANASHMAIQIQGAEKWMPPPEGTE